MKQVLILAALLSGCATWQKPGMTAALLASDEAQCETVATTGMARYFYRAVYAGCMENRGWEER